MVGQALAASLSIPLLVGFRRDLPLDEKLRKLSALRLALERQCSLPNDPNDPNDPNVLST